MALPSSGSISLNQVNVELGLSGTTTISLNDSNVRSLFGVPSGTISMSQGYGKSSVVNISYTFSANTADASLNLSTISGYSAGKSNITVTINSGVYLYATSTGGYGLNITGGTTGDTLTIVNNGFILGQGGRGGIASPLTSPTAGGPALNLGFGMSSCTINNTNASAYIAGGGGGGIQGDGGGGGGAGGGAGGAGYAGFGGSGGGIGASGTTGGTGQGGAGGGGGGRILPGTGGGAGSGTAGGGGGGSGGGGGGYYNGKTNYTGGAGGSGSSVGGGGTGGAGSGGGGWGASGGGSGGAGGKAVNTNGKSITWASGNTTRVYGAVS